MNIFAQRDVPFVCFLKRAGDSYESFCKENDIYPIHNLPLITLAPIKNSSQFNSLVTENGFFSIPLKVYLCRVYASAMKQLGLVRRLVVGAARRKRRSQTSLDLSLCPFGARSTQMDVFDGGKKYTFKVSDLLNLIHSSLTHAVELICDPVAIKNPYTGLKFTKPTLYSIYLMLRESTYAVPPLFALFVGVDFNLDKFEVQYESLLRDEIIKAFVENLSCEKRRDEIRKMMSSVGIFSETTNQIEPIFKRIHVRPNELDQFKKWLHLYFLHLYSLNTYYSHIAFRALVKQMLQFRKENPMFGHKKGKRVI